MVNKRNSGREVFSHVTIGLQLAITMLIFVYGGYKLDLYFTKSPLFLAIGTVLGMGLGFYHLLKNLQIGNKKNETIKDENTSSEKRIKWN